MVILLPLNLLLLIILSKRWLVNQNLFLGWPQAMLLGSIGWGLEVVFITETLSLWRGLEIYAVLSSWQQFPFWTFCRDNTPILSKKGSGKPHFQSLGKF